MSQKTYSIAPLTVRANRVAKNNGSNRATEIKIIDGEEIQLSATRGLG